MASKNVRATPLTLTCEKCGETFAHLYYKPKRYCSRACAGYAGEGERQRRYCPGCGHFALRPEDGCCPRCGEAARREFALVEY